jgi:hypothetical protein
MIFSLLIDSIIKFYRYEARYLQCLPVAFLFQWLLNIGLHWTKAMSSTIVLSPSSILTIVSTSRPLTQAVSEVFGLRPASTMSAFNYMTTLVIIQSIFWRFALILLTNTSFIVKCCRTNTFSVLLVMLLFLIVDQ